MLSTPEPSPRSHMEASSSSGSPARTSSLRPRQVAESNNQSPLITSENGGVWWRSGGQDSDLPELVPVTGPHGVAESAGNRQTAFTNVPSATARELSAAAPSLNSIRGFQTPPAESSSALSRTTGHVQFAVTPGPVPGEDPGTPAPAREATSSDMVGRGPLSGIAGGLSFRGAPASPDRTSKFQTSSMKRYQSLRLPPSNRSAICHFVPLERPRDVAELPLELTLQHSNRIEKVSAPELIPLTVNEKPYYYGTAPSPAVIRALKGSKELRRGAYYVPSDITDAAASGSREVISGTLNWNPSARPVLVQLYVLFPSLMRPPRWLRRDFTEVKTASVEVSWHISKRAAFFLYMMRQLERARKQKLTVWASKKKFAGGETFTLYGAEGTAQLTDRSYILVLKFMERREGAPPKSLTISREAALRASQGLSETSAVPRVGGGGTLPELLATSSFGEVVLKRGLTRLEALQGVQGVQDVLMAAQLSDFSAQFTIPDGGVLTWDTVFDHLVAARDSRALRALIESRLTDPLLKSQGNVDKVEKVAVATNDAALMLVLYHHTPVEMDLNVLAFLVHAWAGQPATSKAASTLHRAASSNANLAAFAAGDEEGEWDVLEAMDPEFGLAAKIEEFLVKYVVMRRNPLSSTAAILRAIEDEMNQHDENRRTMRLAFSRFHSLHLALLRRLNRYAELRSIRVAERVLQPVDLPNTVNEVSPMQVAFDSQDLKFMTEALVELYTRVQWIGRELLALTSHEDTRGMGATNPLLAYSVLRSLGFAGKGTMDPLVMAASRLWHLYAFTSTAFFNSPRGRWAMHAMSELAFLILYEWQVLWPNADPNNLRLVHLFFLVFILGNLLDMLQFVHFRYGSLARIRRYLVDPWNTLSMLVNMGLLVLTILKLAQDFNAPGLPPYQTADAIHMSMATLAVFVWVRALGMAVPMYPSLGPLLNTVARMTEEVVAFLFPMLIVMTGFSTMMTAVYSELVPDSYGSFATSMLTLFSSMLGNFDFTIFDGLTTAQVLYGNITQVVFLVVSAILLMNLLIAIVTNRYRPQEVEAETQFKKAQIVSYYQTQVSRNLVCSPFCLLQFMLQASNLLPSGRRNKVNGGTQALILLGLLPPDGVVLPDDGSDRPTGLGEMPHFIYLVTLYPLVAVVTWLLFLLYTPFGVWQFASKQYTHLGKLYRKKMDAKKKSKNAKADAKEAQGKGEEGEGEEEEQAPTPSEQSASGDPDADPGPQPPSPRPGTPTAGSRPGTPSRVSDVETPQALPATSVDGGRRVSGAGVGKGASKPVSRSASSGMGANDAQKQYLKLKKALQAEARQADMGWVQTVGFVLGTTMLVAVGLLAYLAVVLVVVLVGWSSVYQWLAKLLFSLYNIFLRPIVDMFKVRRRQQRVSPGVGVTSGAAAPPPPPPPAPPVGTATGSHLALDVGSGAAVTVAGGGAVPGSHGCSADVNCTPADYRSGSRLAGLFGGKKASAGAAAGGDADVSQSREMVLTKMRKARMHWQHAIQKVLAIKHERYLSKRDVMKALANSKFKPHMEGWNLSADPRTSSQDILEDQMQDLEDDDDPWDDDEALAAGADDDTIETIILQKTETLSTMLKSGIAAQSDAMAIMNMRLAALTEEVVRLRRVVGEAPESAASTPGADPSSNSMTTAVGRDAGDPIPERETLPPATRRSPSPSFANFHAALAPEALANLRYQENSLEVEKDDTVRMGTIRGVDSELETLLPSASVASRPRRSSEGGPGVGGAAAGAAAAAAPHPAAAAVATPPKPKPGSGPAASAAGATPPKPGGGVPRPPPARALTTYPPTASPGAALSAGTSSKAGSRQPSPSQTRPTTPAQPPNQAATPPAARPDDNEPAGAGTPATSGPDGDRLARSSFGRPTLEPIRSSPSSGSILDGRHGPSSPVAGQRAAQGGVGAVQPKASAKPVGSAGGQPSKPAAQRETNILPGALPSPQGDPPGPLPAPGATAAQGNPPEQQSASRLAAPAAADGPRAPAMTPADGDAGTE